MITLNELILEYQQSTTVPIITSFRETYPDDDLLVNMIRRACSASVQDLRKNIGVALAKGATVAEMQVIIDEELKMLDHRLDHKIKLYHRFKEAERATQIGLLERCLKAVQE